MHVPYSMDDNEPDLYGSLGGHYEQDDSCFSYTSTPQEPLTYTQSDMNKVFKKHQEEIDRLRQEIIDMM